MKAFAGALLCFVILSWGVARLINNITFDIDCGGHMKRAADANSVELATQEMRTVISYLESNGMTSGYTSILYRTPDEDIGFWYKNLKASLQELEATSPQATSLEKSNILMKLRETLLDEGQSTSVTVPEGIGVFPSNTAYMLWSLLGLVTGSVGAILIVMQVDGW